MGQIVERLITDATAGITDDPRIQIPGSSVMVSNFDIFTHPRRITPYLDSEDGDSSAATSKKQAFDIGFWTPSSGSYRLFALGVVSGTARAEVMMKELSTGGSADLGDATWSSPTGGQSASGTTSFALFIYYRKTGLFYGLKAGTTVWAFTPDGSTAFDDSNHSLAYTTAAQGLVHSKDDALYIPYDNKIARNNNGSWTDAAVTLPSHLYITSICEDGNNIAIAAAPKSGIGRSWVFIWDRDASLATLQQSIDFGEGTLLVLEKLNGLLVGISYSGSNSTRRKQRIIFRTSDGSNDAVPFKTYVAAFGVSMSLSQAKQRYDGRVYFSMSLTIGSSVRSGVWSIGKSDRGGFAIANERTIFNNTETGGLNSFFIVGDYYFMSYLTTGVAYALAKTNDQESYTAVSSIEYFENLGDSSITKKLLAATAIFEPLPASGRVTVSYRKDADTSWKRLFAYTTDNGISKTAVNLESDSTAFTVTIASPGVFTLADHGLVAGQRIVLHTTGALPTGLTADTVAYYVISTGLTSSTFRLALTEGGSAINTSGSQSGTHTLERMDSPLDTGKEYYFKVESTGGAVLTGFKYQLEIVPNDVA